mmetsp:Transcript_22674/g.54574  ORF Transcript_22674/g.54574 Transcript_22674/m.54574 type:complete len:210 (-) Transcript_22674:798-1427(-)
MIRCHHPWHEPGERAWRPCAWVGSAPGRPGGVHICRMMFAAHEDNIILHEIAASPFVAWLLYFERSSCSNCLCTVAQLGVPAAASHCAQEPRPSSGRTSRTQTQSQTAVAHDTFRGSPRSRLRRAPVWSPPRLSPCALMLESHRPASNNCPAGRAAACCRHRKFAPAARVARCVRARRAAGWKRGVGAVLGAAVAHAPSRASPTAASSR